MENKFKILVYLNQYVDSNLLEKGIYITNKPTLYNIDETIDSLIERGRNMIDMTGNMFLSESYFDNLNKCKLIEATLIS